MQRDRQKVKHAKQFNLQLNYFRNNIEKKDEEIQQCDPIMLAELYAELKESNERQSDLDLKIS